MRGMLFQVCAAAVMTAVVKALIPSDKYEKQFRILISCFFTAAVLGIFGNIDELSEIADIFGSDMSYNDYSVQVREQTADEIANSLRKSIRDELSKENIFPEKIYIDVNISEETDISISEIRLVFKDKNEEQRQRAVSLTKRLVGYRTSVKAEGP